MPSKKKSPKRTRGAALLTVCGLLAVSGVVAMPYLAGEPVEGRLNEWLRYAGHFHPALLHFPVGMLALVLLLEFGQWFRKDKRSTLVPAIFTAVSAVVAAVCGFLLYQSRPGEYDEALVLTHLWWSIGFAAAVVATVVFKAWIDVRGGAGNGFYVLGLVACAAAMTVASHAGGSLTHGKTFLTDEAPNELRRLYNLLPVEEKLEMKEQEGGVAAPAPTEEIAVYPQLVQPIFDRVCVSCHGEEKQKGKMRMDSYEAALAGGKEGDGFKPGNAEDSNIMFRIHLPEDDEEHMPPEGKKQIEPHEVAILEWWIDGGASPDGKVSVNDLPEEIRHGAVRVRAR